MDNDRIIRLDKRIAKYRNACGCAMGAQFGFGSLCILFVLYFFRNELSAGIDLNLWNCVGIFLAATLAGKIIGIVGSQLLANILEMRKLRLTKTQSYGM
ncbi:MAG: hypothetical protein JNL40_09770 [Cyclobacteriaceae bacterium]|nr:hypothetical protein [Cyclobacteriaceae bacterium]